MDIIENLKRKGAKMLLAKTEHGLPELSKARMDVCKGCEKFNHETKTCGVCGCFMDIKVDYLTSRNPHKGGAIEFTVCPLGKWMDGNLIIINELLNG